MSLASGEVMTFQAFYDAWVQHGNKLLSRAQSFPLHSTASHARWEKNLCLPISHVALVASTAKTPIGAHCLPPISAIGQLPVSGTLIAVGLGIIDKLTYRQEQEWARISTPIINSSHHTPVDVYLGRR